MEDTQVYETLQLAADDAREAYLSNLDKLPHMRMSRAGLPLLQLAMEDFIIPKLPQPFEYIRDNSARVRSLRKTMAIGTGFLYEKAVLSQLQQEFTGVSIESQVKLEFEGITGTLDYLVIDHQNKWAVICECKALDVDSLKQGRDTKLMTDNWGYKTQLCLYLAAVSQKYPDYKLFPQWRLWAKKISKPFTYKPVIEDFADVVTKALDRANFYNGFTDYFRMQDVNACCSVLFDLFDDPLPEKQPFYGGYSASCGFHFSPWSAALLDNDGFLLPQAEANLRVLLSVAFGSKPPRKALELLDTEDHVAV